MASETLSESELSSIDAYWRAANYLTVGQTYLQSNPLLREPLRPEHIKPRLLGHWGTSPGECGGILKQHRTYISEHLEDMPEIRDSKWSTP